MIFLKSRHKKDPQSEKFSIFAHYIIQNWNIV